MQSSQPMGQYLSFCYPIWVGSSLPTGQNGYFSPLGFYSPFYPSLVHQPEQNQQQNKQKEKKQGEKFEEKKQTKDKIEYSKTEQNNQIQKKSSVGSSCVKQKKEKADGGSKAKRPLTYETEKSYYMKQKLKGKMKCNFRILRKRNVDNSSNCIKNKLRKVDSKEQKASGKGKKKKLKFVKLQPKQQKIIKKTKVKILKQYTESLAEVPSIICGVRQLNEWLFTKLQNLRLRQVGKKLLS